MNPTADYLLIRSFRPAQKRVLSNSGCGSLHKSYQSDIPKIIRLRVNFRFYCPERINGVLSFGRNVLTFTGEGTFLGLKSVNLLGSPLPSGTFSPMTNYDFSGHGAKYATDTVHSNENSPGRLTSDVYLTFTNERPAQLLARLSEGAGS
jgi:hypothetical protein